MDAKDLKEYLLEDRRRIEIILEAYDFHEIWYTGDEIRCAPPEGTNRTAISVRLQEGLMCSSYSDLVPFHGDIFGLIENYSKENFKSIIQNIHKILGLAYTAGNYRKKKLDLLSDIRKYKKYSEGSKKENVLHGQHILNGYNTIPHISIMEECISGSVYGQFNICYDSNRDRILFPHYDWINHDKIVGISGRTGMDSETAKELGVPKYWNYIKGYSKTNNLYGYNQAHNWIDKNKMIIIFEAEKSVLKQFTIEKGEGYSVSVGCHELSQPQVEFIIKNTSQDVEVVIAFDKDVMSMKDSDGKSIGEEYLIKECNRFSKYRKTSYIFDTYNTLGEKDAPIDRGLVLWNILLENRRRVN